MPSIKPFFKDKTKTRGTPDRDHLAIVRAAAWAWYQHGSGSNEDEMPTREFDVTRTYQAPRPSRYKLEAMKMMKECAIGQSRTPSPAHTGNSLLDAYEIESISKQLDCLIESSSNRFNGKFFGGRDGLDSQESSAVSSSGGYSSNVSPMKKKKNNNFLKGLWIRHAAVCGTREDVDTRAFVRRKPPAGRHVPVVATAVCRPRAAHAL